MEHVHFDTQDPSSHSEPSALTTIVFVLIEPYAETVSALVKMATKRTMGRVNLRHRGFYLSQVRCSDFNPTGNRYLI